MRGSRRTHGRPRADRPLRAGRPRQRTSATSSRRTSARATAAAPSCLSCGRRRPRWPSQPRRRLRRTGCADGSSMRRAPSARTSSPPTVEAGPPTSLRDRGGRGGGRDRPRALGRVRVRTTSTRSARRTPSSPTRRRARSRSTAPTAASSWRPTGGGARGLARRGPGRKTYEAWVIRDGTPTPAGLFDAEDGRDVSRARRTGGRGRDGRGHARARRRRRRAVGRPAAHCHAELSAEPGAPSANPFRRARRPAVAVPHRAVRRVHRRVAREGQGSAAVQGAAQASRAGRGRRSGGGTDRHALGTKRSGAAPRLARVTTDLQSPLRELFGFDDFRPGQEEVVRSALAERDTLALMPTGSGKSLPVPARGDAPPPPHRRPLAAHRADEGPGRQAAAGGRRAGHGREFVRCRRTRSRPARRRGRGPGLAPARCAGAPAPSRLRGDALGRAASGSSSSTRCIA